MNHTLDEMDCKVFFLPEDGDKLQNEIENCFEKITASKENGKVKISIY